MAEEPRFLCKVYEMVKGNGRSEKTSVRAFNALYGSQDLEVAGGIRVMPYNETADSLELFETEVVVSYKMFKDIMPLLEMAGVWPESIIAEKKTIWKIGLSNRVVQKQDATK